jgi:hypothetical protein
MKDSDVIQQAYEQLINKMFGVLFDASAIAKTPDAQSEAEQNFKAGVLKAREVRDKAAALIS